MRICEKTLTHVHVHYIFIRTKLYSFAFICWPFWFTACYLNNSLLRGSSNLTKTWRGKEDGVSTAHVWNYNKLKRTGREDYLLVDCMSGYIFVEKKFAISQKIKFLEMVNSRIYLQFLYDYSLHPNKYIHKNLVFNESYPLLLHRRYIARFVCIHFWLHAHAENLDCFSSCIFLLIYSVSQRYF